LRVLSPLSRLFQAEMLAQGAAFVLCAEQAAPLQFRHDKRGEGIELARKIGWHHVEAVGRAALEPCLEFVGDLRRRTDDPPVAARAGEVARKLPDREVVPA